jgi:hypothetical protein
MDNTYKPTQPINIKDPKHEGLAEVLKKMWELAYKNDLTPEEAAYWNRYLGVIQNYYTTNAAYWMTSPKFEYGSNRVKG